MSQLQVDSLNEIFRYLESDKFTLRSCMLVNHLWCKISMKFFWRNVYNYNISNVNTLISCLPNESKKILYESGINISNQTSEYNYAKFCKVLSMDRVHYMVNNLLETQQFTLKILVMQELLKMFEKQVSLDCLTVYYYDFTPKNWLKNLSELHCYSNLSSEFFYQLSQICHNISLLDIRIGNYISNGLAKLISVQKNLKYFSMKQDDDNDIPSLITELPNSLIKLNLYGSNCIPLSFISKFSNLQELELSYSYQEDFIGFEELQHIFFPQLQILKIRRAFPRDELLKIFLENNGKNLKEFYLGDFGGISDKSLNLAIARTCPNLKKLSTGFSYELITLQIVFDGCQYLESIRIWYEKKALEAIAKYSHNIDELILYHHSFKARFELLPKELESFFIDWKNRVPQKSLSLIIVTCSTRSLEKNDENMKIIEKYRKLGIIKKFKVTDFNDDDLYLDLNHFRKN
ncbi:uncharacterized protein OCT59_007555 [Rhizophagus irregularis]|nr:hypothetical protein OCT59_007555 [Rhizophagus irregularis]GBC33383.2 hypothetical protein GLOIN_2v1876445 [Rhizophagus irregularis DAOM 181602=DAOM 197198]